MLFRSLVIVDDAGQVRPLTAPGPGYHDRAPSWSPDGRRIAFISDRPAAPERGATRLWVVAADGSTPAITLTAPAQVGAVAWAPDGGSVAWLGLPAGTPPGTAACLWVTTADGTQTRWIPLPGVPAPGAAVR